MNGPLLQEFELNAPGIEKILAYFDGRADFLMTKLVNPEMSHDETQVIRGQVKEIRQFMLAIRPPTNPGTVDRIDAMSGNLHQQRGMNDA